MLHNGNEAVGTDGRVNLYSDSILSRAPELLDFEGAHEAGAIQFAQEFLNVTCHYLGLEDWWYFPSAEDIEGF